MDEARRLQAVHALDILDSPEEPAFDRIARLIRNIFGVRIALVSVLDAHRQWFKAREGVEGRQIDRDGSFCSIVVEQDRQLIIPDTHADPLYAQSRYVIGPPHVRFYAGAPLRTQGGEIVGTVCAIDPEPRDFTRTESLILADLAQLAMDQMELHQTAATDALTGMLSRRGFVREAGHAFTLANRHNHPLSCILFDLDHFKSVNDTFGHAAGDAVLRSVSLCVSNVMRQTDLVGRIGGEEFAVLLPHTGPAGALEVAETLRRAIAELHFHFAGRDLSVTASLGTASLAPLMPDFEMLMAHADAALYEAKANGRNRAVAHRPTSRMPRRRVLKAGRIIFNHKMSTIDCTVRSLGRDGAGIDVNSSVGVPDTFQLQIPSDRFETECRIVAQEERHLEVEF